LADVIAVEVRGRYVGACEQTERQMVLEKLGAQQCEVYEKVYCEQNLQGKCHAAPWPEAAPGGHALEQVVVIVRGWPAAARRSGSGK
jgi:hypothetical protein